MPTPTTNRRYSKPNGGDRNLRNTVNTVFDEIDRDVQALYVAGGVTDTDTVRRGASIISAEESVASRSFSLLRTADRISGLTVPAKSVLVVQFSAITLSSATDGAVALFLGSDQLRLPSGVGAPAANQATLSNAGTYDWVVADGRQGLVLVGGGGTSSTVATGLAGAGIAIFGLIAGRYDLSAQYMSPSGGTVSARERILLARVESYG